MTVSEILDYCLKKDGSTIDYPFGEIPICVKLCKKLVLQLYPHPEDYKVTLKCEPFTGDYYRQKYPGTVLRGYHCPPVQQPYWNTVILNGKVSGEELKIMIDEAFACVIKKLPKKVREQMK